MASTRETLLCKFLDVVRRESQISRLDLCEKLMDRAINPSAERPVIVGRLGEGMWQSEEVGLGLCGSRRGASPFVVVAEALARVMVRTSQGFNFGVIILVRSKGIGEWSRAR